MSIYAKTKYGRERCRGCGSEELEDSSDSRWWIPGVIVVQFEKPVAPGQVFPSPDSPPETDLEWLDVDGLKEAVGHHLWDKPPKLTFAPDEGHGPIDPKYKNFLTFYLKPNANVPEIAKALRQLRGVVRAAGEPRLTPPKQRIPNEPIAIPHSQTLNEAALLGEPLAIRGGAPLGLSVSIGEGAERFQNQWYLFRSRADEVVTELNGEGVVVADIDWGFNDTHQEFVNKIKFKYNAASDGVNISSGTMKWHGTGTLGLIGAGDNNAGMLGFAAGADLWAIKAQYGEIVDNELWKKAINKVRDTPSDNKRKVILVEASSGGSNVEYSTMISGAITQAIEAGCVVCVPAGNGGEDAGFFQGDLDDPIPVTGSILVGATQYTDDTDVIEPGESNFGSRIVVSAPGDTNKDVTCCTCANNTYRDRFGGTSGAAAKVAGAMALVLQKFPDVTHQQIVRAFAKMDRIPTDPGGEMGCFLDLPVLLEKVEEVLIEDGDI